MKTALITGSETFGKYVTHTAKYIALKADGRVIAGHKVHSLIFPSIIRLPSDAEDHGTTIVRKALEIHADVILSFGLSSTVNGFRMERSATNWIHNEWYCPAYEQNRPIDTNRPTKEKVQIDLTPWNIDEMAKKFAQKNIPFEPNISDDPGTYACNGWIYRTARALKTLHADIPYVFIHTACIKESIACMPDFPRDKKVLLKKSDLMSALAIFLSSYSKERNA